MINNYIWKGERVLTENGSEQKITKLVDCTESELRRHYKHCKQMLYNEDPDKPGRYPLLNTIEVQRNRCGAELFVRHLRKNKIYEMDFLIKLNTLIRKSATEEYSEDYIKGLEISNLITECPVELGNIPTHVIIDACLDTLGVFNRNHISLSLILKQGLWLTQQELIDLTEKSLEGQVRDRREVIKERLKMSPKIRIKIDPKGLNYEEFRAMIKLQTKKYSELTSQQLITLRERLLFNLEEDVHVHIENWLTLIEQIEEVAEHKGYNLN